MQEEKRLYLFHILSVSVLVSLPFEEWNHQLSQEVYLRSQTENRASITSASEKEHF